MPFYEHGYNASGGKLPDPNSARTERKNRGKGGPPEGQPKSKAPPPSKAPGHQVKEIFYPSIIGGEICVLGGSNLRILRGGLGLCSPGIIPPENRSSKPFWAIIKKRSLSTTCNKSMFKQDELRSSSLVSLLQEIF